MGAKMNSELFLRDYAQKVRIESNSNQQLDFDSDYRQYQKLVAEANEIWKTSPKVREQYKNKQNLFMGKKIGQQYSSQASKNYFLTASEVEKRANCYFPSRLLEVGLLDSRNMLLDIMESYENIDHIKDIYRVIKANTSKENKAGLNSDEAKKVQYCLRQGRELYLSGNQSNHIVKPLIYFYSITAFSYATILLNNPFRFKLESISNSHGIDHKLATEYVSFGGDIKNGTFSELFYSFCTEHLLSKVDINNNFDVHLNKLESFKHFQKNRFTVSLYTIFNMMPEMQSVLMAEKNRIFPLSINYGIHAAVPYYKLRIGDGNQTINQNSINSSFGSCEHHIEGGQNIVTIPIDKIRDIQTTIYTDIYGKLWYIESPFPEIQIPEMCLHFMAIFALSNIMRYQPEIWGAILANEYETKISTLIRYYLTLFEQKLPFLIMRSTSNFYPVVTQ